MLPLTLWAGDGLKRITKAEAVLELLWLSVVVGVMMRPSGANWPGERSEWVVPLTILALAALTGDESRSARACSTLFRIAVVPGMLVLGVLVGRIEPEWMNPEWNAWSGGLAVALLYPALNGIRTRTSLQTTAATGILAVLVSVIIQGNLSMQTAGKMISPLYEAGRCVGNGGFEIVAAMVLTLGWYGFATVGMQAAESFGTQLKIKGKYSKTGMLLLSSLTLVSGKEMTEWVLVSGCLIMWILVPILHSKNNLKKDEKRC